MNKLAKGAVIVTALTGVSAGLTSVQAQEQQPPSDSWFKLCQKQQDTDVCNIQFIKASKDTGQLLGAVSLIELKGKANRRIVQITVPPMRILPPGVRIQVDGGKAQKVDYVICPLQPNPSCIAEAPLTDGLLKSLKRGSKLTVTAVNFQNQPTPIDISLKGFTGVYEGPAIKQSDVAEKNKQLEAQMKAKQAEFAQKLKDEQERVKGEAASE